MTNSFKVEVMAANGRGGMRPSGRSPPFLLIGLTVVLCIVGFNYWNVSSRNNQLSADLTALRDQMRSQTAMRINAEKRSENSASRIRDCEENKSKIKQMFDETKMSIKKSEDRLNTLESELQSASTDLKRCQDDKAACENDKIGINEQLHKVQEMLAEKEKEVATQPKCGFEQCKAEIGNIVNILTNTIGKEPIKNSLLQNNIDVSSLMSLAGDSDAIKQGSNSENLHGNPNYQGQQPGQIDSGQPVDPNQQFNKGQNAVDNNNDQPQAGGFNSQIDSRQPVDPNQQLNKGKNAVNNNNNQLQAGGLNPQIDSRQPVDPNQQLNKGQNAVDNNNNQLQAGGFNHQVDSRQPVDPNQQLNNGQNAVDNKNQPQEVQNNLPYPGNQNQLPPAKSDTDQQIPVNADGNQAEPNHANLDQPGNIDQHDKGTKSQFQPNPDQKGQFPVNKGQSASDPKDQKNPRQIFQNTVQEALKGNTGTEQQTPGQGPVKVGQEQLKVGQEQMRLSQELKPGQEEIKSSQEQIKSDRESIDTPKNPVSNAESNLHQQQNMLHVSQENKVPGSTQLNSTTGTLERQEQPKSPTQSAIPNQIDQDAPEEDKSKMNDLIVDNKVEERLCFNYNKANKGQSASDPKDQKNPRQIFQNTVQEALKGNTGTEQQTPGQGPVKVGQEQLKVGQEQMRLSQELKPGQEEIKSSQEQIKSDRESIDTPKNPVSNAESNLHQQQNMLHVSQENKVPGSTQLNSTTGTLERQEQPKSPTQSAIPNQIDQDAPEEDKSKMNDLIVDNKVEEKSPGQVENIVKDNAIIEHGGGFRESKNSDNQQLYRSPALEQPNKPLDPLHYASLSKTSEPHSSNTNIFNGSPYDQQPHDVMIEQMDKGKVNFNIDKPNHQIDGPLDEAVISPRRDQQDKDYSYGGDGADDDDNTYKKGEPREDSIDQLKQSIDDEDIPQQ